jgi:S1-C subfamily serine protease
VADLTQRLHGDTDDILRMVQGGSRGAMLGVNIGSDQKRDDGVELMSVSPGGPAESAGLRKGDVLVAIDARPLRRTGDVTPSHQLVDYLRNAKPGQVVKIDYLRDGKRQTASVATGAAEPPMTRMFRQHLPGGMMPPGFEEFVGHRRSFGALELVPMTPKLGQYFGTDRGLLVVRAPSTPGAKLEEGDVILTIDGRTPENPRHAFRILGSYQPNDKLKIEVMRQRKRTTLDVQMPDMPMEGDGFEPRGPVPAIPAVPPLPPAPQRPDTTSS